MAAERGPFLDQSQSLNLFMESPTIGALSSMYFYAWQRGLKTTYYLRSRPATRIRKATVSEPPAGGHGSNGQNGHGSNGHGQKRTYSDAEAVACSLENPEACEACQ
jgi:ribonucleoside-diphosphate reductase alpha chain